MEQKTQMSKAARDAIRVETPESRIREQLAGTTHDCAIEVPELKHNLDPDEFDQMFESPDAMAQIDKLAQHVATEMAACVADKAALTKRNASLDAAKEQLHTMLKEAGMQSCKLECGLNPRATVKMQYYAVGGISGPEMFAWLKANDLADIIKPTVNFNTLQSTLKEYEAQGGEVPDTVITKSPKISVTMGGKSAVLAAKEV